MAKESTEQHLWKAHPSQLIALQFYFVCALIIAVLLTGAFFASDLGSVSFYAAIAALVVVLVAAVKYFVVRSTAYSLSNERLIIESGILSRSSEEIELYRVKDWSVSQPFHLRLAGVGHLRITSTDSTAPSLELLGVAKPNEVRDVLRTNVEAARDKKAVRHLEVEGSPAD